MGRFTLDYSPTLLLVFNEAALPCRVARAQWASLSYSRTVEHKELTITVEYVPRDKQCRER